MSRLKTLNIFKKILSVLKKNIYGLLPVDKIFFQWPQKLRGRTRIWPDPYLIIGHPGSGFGYGYVPIRIRIVVRIYGSPGPDPYP
jgi:hypothetical protein